MPKAGKSDAGSWIEKSGSVGAALVSVCEVYFWLFDEASLSINLIN
jgi:hypothetical protein